MSLPSAKHKIDRICKSLSIPPERVYNTESGLPASNECELNRDQIRQRDSLLEYTCQELTALSELLEDPSLIFKGRHANELRASDSEGFSILIQVGHMLDEYVAKTCGLFDYCMISHRHSHARKVSLKD